MTEKESVYDKNTIEIKGLPDFSNRLGCFTIGNEFTHFGSLFPEITVCGKQIESVMTGRDVTVNCPECVAEMKYRHKHPEAAKKNFGVVTHK